MTSPSKRTVGLDQRALDDLTERLQRTLPQPSRDASWERGVPSDWLAALVRDWQNHDFPGLRARLASMDHLTADVNGQLVHCLHVKGAGESPAPLVLTHGWPSSFLEFEHLIELLTDPARHGASATDSFSVIVPSLPGFGFSGSPPAQGLSSRAVAELWHGLVATVFGYRRFFAHGGDLGAGVTAWLARLHPDSVAAVHLATPGLPIPPKPWAPSEASYVHEVERWSSDEGAYSHQQSTKPATLAAGLLDSPVGLAAWIGEKVAAWSEADDRGAPKFPRRLLLDTLTLYWCTRTIGTSFLPYWQYQHNQEAALPATGAPAVPTAIAMYGGERVPFPKAPRVLAERYFDVVSWSSYELGGHFPAVAAPELLAGDLRDCFRPYRQDVQ